MRIKTKGCHFKIDESKLKKFKRICKREGLKMREEITRLIEKWIEEKQAEKMKIEEAKTI